MASQSTISLYGQTYQEILSKVIGGSKRFQLVHPFMDWTWNIPPAGYIDATAYDILGQMPSYSAIGSASYTPSATDLYSAYRNMLLQCPKLTETAGHMQQLKEAQDQINAAQTTYQNQLSARKTAWMLANKDIPHGMPPPVYNEWNVQSGWANMLKADQEAVDKAAETKSLIVAQQNPAYTNALATSKMPGTMLTTKAGFAKCQIQGQDSWRPNFIFTNGQDWAAQLTQGGGISLSIQLDASESSYALKESWAGGATDFGSSFFGIYANGSWHEMDLNTEDRSVKVSIEIKAVTQVPVRPDSWYDAGYMKTLTKMNQWNQPFTTEKVFGKDGILPLMINGIVAGYQISFKITMSTETYQRHQESFNVSGGIRIGPFHIGGGYKTSSDTWNKSTDGKSFSGQSTSTYPFIIGFTVATPGLE